MGRKTNLFTVLQDAIIARLSQGTWTIIEDECKLIGLPWRTDLEPGWGKPKYLKKVLREFQPNQTVAVGVKCIEHFTDDEYVRSIQNALWWIETDGKQELTDITRKAILNSLDGRKLNPQLTLKEFLHDYVTENESQKLDFFEYGDDGFIYRKNDSINFADYFSQLDVSQKPESTNLQRITFREIFHEIGFSLWPDRRVNLLFENLVRPEIRQGAEQTELVHLLNQQLQRDGFVLREKGLVSGHPEFSVVKLSASGVLGRPKNLIFASNGIKPTLGFVDAINNDIVVLDNEKSCLIYDEPILQGLTWKTLVQWWARNQKIAQETEARQSLGMRLKESLAKESPPEHLLFETYFQVMHEKLGDKLPALLPQVYLHYDPKNIYERKGIKKFPVQRMDFLLLLSPQVRIIIEVDGSQHYSSNGRPSPEIYAETVRGDRELRLMGYEVYRFGGAELIGENGKSLVAQFFLTLFNRHNSIMNSQYSQI